MRHGSTQGGIKQLQVFRHAHAILRLLGSPTLSRLACQSGEVFLINVCECFPEGLSQGYFFWRWWTAKPDGFGLDDVLHGTRKRPGIFGD